MKEYLNLLSMTALFAGIEKHNIESLLSCVGAHKESFHKGELIVREGSRLYDFGLLLSGQGRSFRVDKSGNIITITRLKPGSEIGVIFAASFSRKSPVSVEALEDVDVLKIPYDNFITTCRRSCFYHDRMIRNYINVLAEKWLDLYERLDCVLQGSVREKIMTYLLQEVAEQGSNEVILPFDRQGMAEFLNIERSALSRELSKMKRDGLIDYRKNSFKLL